MPVPGTALAVLKRSLVVLLAGPDALSSAGAALCVLWSILPSIPEWSGPIQWDSAAREQSAQQSSGTCRSHHQQGPT